MKSTYVLASIILSVLKLALSAQIYVITPVDAQTSQNQPTSAILAEGQALYAEYGSRPPYKGPVFAPKQPLGAAEAQNVIPYIIACESGGRNVKTLDDNNRYSYGVLQIQSSTAEDWNALAGTDYDPMIPEQAITLAEWALENGFIQRWSCARILNIIK